MPFDKDGDVIPAHKNNQCHLCEQSIVGTPYYAPKNQYYVRIQLPESHHPLKATGIMNDPYVAGAVTPEMVLTALEQFCAQTRRELGLVEAVPA